MVNKVQKWLNKLNEIQNSYPFGEIKEFRNEENQLHRLGGPAYTSKTRVTFYEVGRKHGIDVDIFGSISYYWRGTAVPSNYITSPETLTIDEIIKHPNTEVRRVGMEIYGFERAIQEGKAVLIHSDPEMPADLYHIAVTADGKSTQRFVDDPLALVRVLDGTPDENGNRRVFFLKVPPTSKTCREGVAWTFRREENNYRPMIER